MSAWKSRLYDWGDIVFRCDIDQARIMDAAPEMLAMLREAARYLPDTGGDRAAGVRVDIESLLARIDAE